MRKLTESAPSEVPVFGSPYFDIADVNGLKGETEASGRLGFHGKRAIHPAQIAIINEVLTPTEEEVAKACQVLVVNRQGVVPWMARWSMRRLRARQGSYSKGRRDPRRGSGFFVEY